MQNIVPIQITLQAANASDVQQLVHDLAGTMSGLPQNRIPQETNVSTLPPAAPQAPVSPTPEQQQWAAPTSPPAQQYQPSASAVPTQPATPTGQVPTTAPAYTVEQLGVAAGPLVDAGRAAELTAWLQQHGANALTALDKSYYGEFATFLRSLGARI